MCYEETFSECQNANMKHNIILQDCTFMAACSHLAKSYGAESLIDCIASDDQILILLTVGTFVYDYERRYMIAVRKAE